MRPRCALQLRVDQTPQLSALSEDTADSAPPKLGHLTIDEWVIRVPNEAGTRHLRIAKGLLTRDRGSPRVGVGGQRVTR
jgi:hypothetical protein